MASHLYFADCNFDPWFAFLGTHPPLAKRVSAIDPQFDGQFAAVKMLTPNQAERDLACSRFVVETMAINRKVTAVAPAAAAPFTSDHIRQAAIVRYALPDEVNHASRTPGGAADILYALLLSDEAPARGRQWELLRTNLEPADFGQFQILLPLVEAMDDRYKLPLAEFAVPALRDDAGTASSFTRLQQQLIECDASIGLFEYTLLKMVTRQLRAYFEGPAASAPKFGRVRDVLPQCGLLLSALAHVGNDGETEARQAFAQGAGFLDAPGEAAQFLTRSEWDLAAVDAALAGLAAYHEPLRRNVLRACSKTVAADGQVTVREAELLRAVADALDCPMPPFIEAIRGEALAGNAAEAPASLAGTCRAAIRCHGEPAVFELGRQMNRWAMAAPTPQVPDRSHAALCAGNAF